ncbi:hypothetical protein SDJN02_20884, partial [Cucurbita argyrosperma subsp. argyrosperma]
MASREREEREMAMAMRDGYILKVLRLFLFFVPSVELLKFSDMERAGWGSISVRFGEYNRFSENFVKDFESVRDRERFVNCGAFDRTEPEIVKLHVITLGFDTLPSQEVVIEFWLCFSRLIIWIPCLFFATLDFQAPVLEVNLSVNFSGKGKPEIL